MKKKLSLIFLSLCIFQEIKPIESLTVTLVSLGCCYKLVSFFYTSNLKCIAAFRTALLFKIGGTPAGKAFAKCLEERGKKNCYKIAGPICEKMKKVPVVGGFFGSIKKNIAEEQNISIVQRFFEIYREEKNVQRFLKQYRDREKKNSIVQEVGLGGQSSPTIAFAQYFSQTSGTAGDSSTTTNNTLNLFLLKKRDEYGDWKTWENIGVGAVCTAVLMDCFYSKDKKDDKKYQYGNNNKDDKKYPYGNKDNKKYPRGSRVSKKK